MRQIGITMILLGAGSFLINLMGMEFMLLQWVDNWGSAAGIGIRLGFIVLGGVLVAATPGESD